MCASTARFSVAIAQLARVADAERDLDRLLERLLRAGEVLAPKARYAEVRDALGLLAAQTRVRRERPVVLEDALGGGRVLLYERELAEGVARMERERERVRRPPRWRARAGAHVAASSYEARW